MEMKHRLSSRPHAPACLPSGFRGVRAGPLDGVLWALGGAGGGGGAGGFCGCTPLLCALLGGAPEASFVCCLWKQNSSTGLLVSSVHTYTSIFQMVFPYRLLQNRFLQKLSIAPCAVR